MSLNWDKLSRDRQLSLKARIVPENDDELYEYIRFFWGIEFPRKAYCPHCTPPFQVLSDCYFARYRTALLKASRGCGKSSLLATLTLTELISLNTEIMILGASQVQSLKILEYIKGDTTRFEGCFWDAPNAPKWLLNEKEYLKEEIWTIPNAKGISGNIKCFTASPKSVRGQRPLRLRCLTGDTAVHTPFGLRRLDTIRPGDEVVSFDGNKFVNAKVSRFLNNGIRDYYNVELSNGNTIKATGNHKLLTAEGWLTVDEIMLRMSQSSGQEGEEPYRLLRGVFETKKSTRSFRSGGPVHGLFSTETKNCSFEMPKVLLREQKKNLSFLRRLWSSAKAEEQEVQKLSSEVDVQRRLRPVSGGSLKGNERQPFVYRIKNERASSYRECSLPDTSACEQLFSGFFNNSSCNWGDVESRDARFLLARFGTEKSERRAKESVFGRFGLPSNYLQTRQYAHLALLASTYVEVVKIKPAGRARVYDLTVPGYSCFVAEGVVVHNCDEVDEADQQLIEDALGCPRDNPKLGLKANTLLSSTHQHVDGTLTHYIERFSEANRQAGKIVAPIYTFCFKDLLTTNGGYLDPEEMEGLRATVSERTWLTEYLNGEPPRDQLMFSKEDLDFMFDPSLGSFAGANGEECFLEQTNDDYVEYAIGSDWAKKKDMTVFCALAANPNPDGPDVLVGAMCMNKIPWPDMVSRYDEFYNRFSPGMGFHDITGNSHLEDLIECDSEPFLFTSKSKKSVVDALIIAVQQHKIKCPKIASMEREFRSLDFAKCYGEKHLPDWVAALALAWKARQVLNPINIDII